MINLAKPLLITNSYQNRINIWDTLDSIWKIKISIELEKEQLANIIKITENKKNIIWGCTSQIKLYELNEEKELVLNSKSNLNYNINGLVIRNDFEWLICGCEGGYINIFDNKLKYSELLYDNKKIPIYNLSLHPNQGDLCIVDYSFNLKIYDLTCSKIRDSFKNPLNINFTCCQYSNNLGYLIAGDSYGYIHIWYLKNSLLIENNYKNWKIHEEMILNCQINNNVNYIPTCSRDKTIIVLKIIDELNISVFKILYGHDKWVWDIKFLSDNNHLISVSSDGTLKLWNFIKGKNTKSFNQFIEKDNNLFDSITNIAINEDIIN